MVVSVHDDVVVIRDVTLIRRLFSSYTKDGEEKGEKGEDPTPFPTRRDPSLEQTNRLDSSSKTWDGRRKKKKGTGRLVVQSPVGKKVSDYGRAPL